MTNLRQKRGNAIAMTQTQETYAAELEYQQLIQECHSLIVVIAQKPYAIKLLRA